jgi:hypothetical protein
VTQALLVDPFQRHVNWLTLPADQEDWRSIASVIGCEHIEEVRLMAASESRPGVSLFVDEEGVAKDDQRFWSFVDHPGVVYGGKAVVTCVDAEGNCVPGVNTPKQVQSHIKWRNLRFCGFRDSTTVVKHPVLGRVPAVKREAVFEEIQ